MENQSRDMSVGRTIFGERKAVSKVCVADQRRHIRTLLGGVLQELGFMTCECAEPAELGAVLDAHVPGLVVLGLSAGGAGANAMLTTLAAKQFSGMVLPTVLPLAANDGPVAPTAAELGKRLGLAMLPALGGLSGESLREGIARCLPIELPNRAIDLDTALRRGWLELWYQPKVDARTLTLTSAEALARMYHPYWGILQPSRFLPDSGDRNLRALSKFVIDQAVADWRYFLATHKRLDISINLPVSFLRIPESLAYLHEKLPDHPAFGLIVEIDAAEIIRNLPLMRDLARELRFHHIAIAVDDLGTDWPALAGLDDFPFTKIKADRAVVSGCADDHAKRKVCRQILDLANSYGARTVAEGVETRADFLAVRDMGFDLIQGYMFGKPMAAKKFARRMLCPS
jgi:EAL domain-containing protein (putative c-di-GMP-specific phosphodiesterase class I)